MARHGTLFCLASCAAALAGLAYAMVWATLIGATFFLDDLPRITLLVGADLLIACWFLFAAWTLERPRPPGLASVGVFLLIRAIIEVRYLAGLLFPGPPRNPGTSPGIRGHLHRRARPERDRAARLLGDRPCALGTRSWASRRFPSALADLSMNPILISWTTSATWVGTRRRRRLCRGR
jgi:hypothetical protein